MSLVWADISLSWLKVLMYVEIYLKPSQSSFSMWATDVQQKWLCLNCIWIVLFRLCVSWTAVWKLGSTSTVCIPVNIMLTVHEGELILRTYLVRCIQNHAMKCMKNKCLSRTPLWKLSRSPFALWRMEKKVLFILYVQKFCVSRKAAIKIFVCSLKWQTRTKGPCKQECDVSSNITR